MEIVYYRHNKSQTKAHTLKDNKIAFNELTFVLKGKLEYQIDGSSVCVGENDCIFIKSGSIRTRIDSPLSDYISFNFKSDNRFDFPTLITDCISYEIKLLFTVCDGVYEKYYDWTVKIAYALDMILEILRDKLISNEENPLIIKAKKYIKQNYREKLSLKKIAAEAGYSLNYFCALFKRLTGNTVMDFVTNERIAEAKRLISENVLSLTAIAEAVGFTDYNFFARTFKKKCDYTPTEYRKMNR